MLKSMIVGLVLLASPVVAQEDTRCIQAEAAHGYFESVKFTRVFIGDFPQIVDGKPVMMTLEIWGGPTPDGALQWTAFVTFPNGKSCLLTEGMAFDVQELPPNV